MLTCKNCNTRIKKAVKDTYCSLGCYKQSFASRMNEMKELKRKALEQQQLHAEFMANPGLYQAPGVPKTEAEVKLDKAFGELKAKLQSEQQIKKDRIEEAFNNILRKANGEI